VSTKNLTISKKSDQSTDRYCSRCLDCGASTCTRRDRVHKDLAICHPPPVEFVDFNLQYSRTFGSWICGNATSPSLEKKACNTRCGEVREAAGRQPAMQPQRGDGGTAERGFTSCIRYSSLGPLARLVVIERSRMRAKERHGESRGGN
jgi:hypothetical protein